MTDQQALQSEASGNLSHPDIWRNEIHARVAGYRTRRGRRIEGAFSMRFPFPPLEHDVSGSGTNAPADPEQVEQFVAAGIAGAEQTSAEQMSAAEVASSGICDLAPGAVAAEAKAPPTESPTLPELVAENQPPTLPEVLVDTDREPIPPPLPRPRAQRKVIAFPRQAAGAPEMHRLADPVLLEQPRILDVPEELEALPTTPFLDGLQFGPTTQPVIAVHADNVELPFRAAGRAHRLYAGLLDCLLVAAGTAVFAAVGYKMLPKLTFSKPVLVTAATLPLLLWAIYQYLLLVYGGATAGMRIAKIRLSTFTGKSPCRRKRRHRVMALYFSMASFVMGLLWAFVDVDSLCWHDRISRTYLTDRE
ncbi:MAG: RDD family protein [Terriglobales bacterium]